jgi:hypothetical protein
VSRRNCQAGVIQAGVIDGSHAFPRSVVGQAS